MAKIIESNIESNPVSKSYSIWKIATVGVVLGIIYWSLTIFVSRYIESNIASDVATIITATLGVITMLSLRMARPLLVALAAAMSLWGLGALTSGLVWYEAIAWTLLLYTLAYILFSWIARFARIVPVLIVAITIIVLLRIATTL